MYYLLSKNGMTIILKKRKSVAAFIVAGYETLAVSRNKTELMILV